MQMEYLKNKTSPDFIKLCNPEWNENITEEEGFIHALKLADEFWDLYIKHAVAEIEAIEIIIKKTNETNENYAIFDKELPYRKAIDLLENKNIKYLIFKSKRECYDIRIIDQQTKFKKEIVIDDINQAKKLSKIRDLLYIDTNRYVTIPPSSAATNINGTNILRKNEPNLCFFPYNIFLFFFIL